MPKLRNPLAFALFLAVTLGGSWWVIQQGLHLQQQKNLDEAHAVYTPPRAQPMAQSALPRPFVFEASPQKQRWRRVAQAPSPSPTLLCFWVDFSPEDYALLKKHWGLPEDERRLSLFVDGFLPSWFLEDLCGELSLCPGKERVAALKASEVWVGTQGRRLFYTLPRLYALLGCAEEG